MRPTPSLNRVVERQSPVPSNDWYGSATVAGLKRLDDSFQTDLDIDGGISALLGLTGRSSLQGALEVSPSADGSRPKSALRIRTERTLNV